MQIPFIKYEGAGNDFILIEESLIDPLVSLASLARAVCHRRKGIGADGLLLLGSSRVADYRMRIINADGSEPSMCGNGAYCLLQHIHKRIFSFQEISLETRHAILQARREGEDIFLNLGDVSCQHFPLYLKEDLPCYVVHTGVPHAVIWTQNLDRLDVETEGRLWREDARFLPEGVNVNFAERNEHGIIRMRTYERGVEAETSACGTGAAAVAFVAKQLYSLGSMVCVETCLDFHAADKKYAPLLHFLFSRQRTKEVIEMRGVATEVFEGVWRGASGV